MGEGKPHAFFFFHDLVSRKNVTAMQVASGDDWGITIHKMLVDGVAECGGAGRQVLNEVSND